MPPINPAPTNTATAPAVKPGAIPGRSAIAKADVAGERRHQEAEGEPAEAEQHRTEILRESAGRQVPQRVAQRVHVRVRVGSPVGLVGDLVAAEQEAECDQQTTGRDEWNHVAHTGEQDLPGAGAPADTTGGRGASGGRVGTRALDAGGVRIVRGGKRFGDHLGRLVDRPLDSGRDDRLAREAALVLHTDIGGEDDGGGAGDRRRIERRASRRALRLDVQRHPGLLCRGDERVGGHIGVGDPCRAGGDRHQGLRRVGGRRLGRGRGLGLLAGIEHLVHESDDLVGRPRVAQRLYELLAHQRAGQARQQLHVIGAACFGGRDQEREVGGAVGGAEVDGRL